ncbi:hypothetical protein [Dictyobacter formicarum]|uniref:Uncharacterized protein n=1 Tax=Dictyobacter formicarum TaxID=2778368 RepID=A0ABQ3VMW6_9CHLR|nr:hypothetical protein [Dictyobacter formicarum]GHO87567.1 hypothetical protein KSZ_55730 [Dictyobacter formicarum]
MEESASDHRDRMRSSFSFLLILWYFVDRKCSIRLLSVFLMSFAFKNGSYITLVKDEFMGRGLHLPNAQKNSCLAIIDEPITKVDTGGEVETPILCS